MKFLLIIILSLLLLGDAAWWIVGVESRFPWQLRTRLAAEPSSLVLLDVRTPWEYDWFHLPGAKNAPLLLAEAGNPPSGLPSQEIVVICMSGHRSPIVAYALKKRGYARVSHLAGGMLGWKVYEWVSRWRGGGETPVGGNESAR